MAAPWETESPPVQDGAAPWESKSPPESAPWEKTTAATVPTLLPDSARKVPTLNALAPNVGFPDSEQRKEDIATGWNEGAKPFAFDFSGPVGGPNVQAPPDIAGLSVGQVQKNLAQPLSQEGEAASNLAAGGAEGLQDLVNGVTGFFTSGKGLSQLGAAATPIAPAVYAKWAYDMAKAGYGNAQDAVDDFKKEDWQKFGKDTVSAFGSFLGAKGAAGHGVGILGNKAIGELPSGIAGLGDQRGPRYTPVAPVIAPPQAPAASPVNISGEFARTHPTAEPLPPIESVALDPATGNPLPSSAQVTLDKAAQRMAELQASERTPNASTKPGPTSVSEPEIRTRVGQEAPLQQQGEAPGAPSVTPDVKGVEPKSSEAQKVTDISFLEKPMGSHGPEVIASIPDDVWDQAMRKPKGEKWSMTADATAWAMNQKATPELLARLDALAKEDTAKAIAKGEFPQKAQWYSDAAHVLKGDEVGLSNVKNVQDMASKGRIKIVFEPDKPNEIQTLSSPLQPKTNANGNKERQVGQVPPVEKPKAKSELGNVQEHASHIRANENGGLIDADGNTINPGDGIKLSFAGGPSDMPTPWTLVRAENYPSSVNYKLNPRVIVRAANGKERTYDTANVYSPRLQSPKQPSSPKPNEIQTLSSPLQPKAELPKTTPGKSGVASKYPERPNGETEKEFQERIKGRDWSQLTLSDAERARSYQYLAGGKVREVLNASEISTPKKLAEFHRKEVKAALESGKFVPPEVLKDYPDLQASAPKPSEAAASPESNNPPVVEAAPVPPVEPPTPPTPPAPPHTPMGAATPAEFEHSPQTPTGIKNATVDLERSKRGLPPAMQAAKRSFGEVWDQAMAKVDKDPGFQDSLIEELKAKPRALTDLEDALVLHRQIDLQNEYGKATRDLAQAFDDGRDESVIEEKARVARISDQLQDIYDIGKRSGTETARGLNARKMMAYEDFSLANMELQKRAANDGKPLTDAQRAEITELHKKLAETQKAFDDYVAKTEAEEAARAANEAIDEIVKNPKKKTVSNMDTAERTADLTDKIREKVEGGKKNEITSLVQKLARHFVENGITERDALIDAVHEVLKTIDPEFSRRKTMDAISGYGDFKQFSKDEISVKLRDLKGQMQQIAKLEDMQAGKPPLKTGLERRIPSKEESRLIKLVNDAKQQFQIPISDPNTQLKSSLDTLKTRLRNRIDELQQKLDNKDFTTKKRRELKLDAEAMRLKAKVENVKESFQRALMADKLSKRTTWEKAQDTFVKWRRAFILSGPVTLAKLTSAALERVGFSALEEGIGGALSKVPLISKVSKMAPREGGFSVKAEAKAITEGLTAGMRDAWSVLKTGRSELDALYGKRDIMPRSAIDFFGNLHGFLKAPVKRAEFSKSFEKRVQHAIASGIDPTDPMVQMRLATEAYKDSNRSIFMQDNRVVDAYKRGMSRFSQVDKATGKVPFSSKLVTTTAKALLPIVKIPTNIVAETFQYATGTVTGSVRLASAFRKGIDTLPPEHADLIMRELKKGSLGAAVLLLGYLSADSVGGYYQAGQKRDPKDVGYGKVRVFGHDIPSYLVHNPLLEVLQLGATIRRVSDAKIHKKDAETQGLEVGLMAGALGLTEEVPFVREMMETSKAFKPGERGAFFGELGKSMLVPQILQWEAQREDKDAQGNPIKRTPGTFTEYIKSGIPGLRQTVPSGKPKRGYTALP